MNIFERILDNLFYSMVLILLVWCEIRHSSWDGRLSMSNDRLVLYSITIVEECVALILILHRHKDRTFRTVLQEQ
jgi:hypothetical protein